MSEGLFDNEILVDDYVEEDVDVDGSIEGIMAEALAQHTSNCRSWFFGFSACTCKGGRDG